MLFTEGSFTITLNSTSSKKGVYLPSILRTTSSKDCSAASKW